MKWIYYVDNTGYNCVMITSEESTRPLSFFFVLFKLCNVIHFNDEPNQETPDTTS